MRAGGWQRIVRNSRTAPEFPAIYFWVQSRNRIGFATSANFSGDAHLGNPAALPAMK
jgi:hypothetical protein